MKKTATKPAGKKPAGKTFSMKALLANASKHLKKAKARAAEESTFEEFEDGRYIAQLMEAMVEKSQAGRTQIRYVWEFRDGEYEGKQKYAYQGLDSEDNLTFALRDLERLGYDVSEMEDIAEELPAILAELKKEKPTAKIQLKTKGDFQNVYINAIVEDGDLEDEDEDDEEEEKPKSKKRRATKDEDDEEEESDDEDEDEETDDEEEESEDEEDDDAEDDEDGDDDEDEDAEEDDEEEVEVRVGSTVTVKTKSGDKKGEILEVLEDENAVRVKTEDGKTLKLNADRILAVHDVEEKPKGKKKPAAKKPVSKKR